MEGAGDGKLAILIMIKILRIARRQGLLPFVGERLLHVRIIVLCYFIGIVF